MGDKRKGGYENGLGGIIGTLPTNWTGAVLNDGQIGCGISGVGVPVPGISDKYFSALLHASVCSCSSSVLNSLALKESPDFSSTAICIGSLTNAGAMVMQCCNVHTAVSKPCAKDGRPVGQNTRRRNARKGRRIEISVCLLQGVPSTPESPNRTG